MSENCKKEIRYFTYQDSGSVLCYDPGFELLQMFSVKSGGPVNSVAKAEI